MSNITVLLSTYNGEKYLPEQLDSILKQQNVKVRLLVRDDGSGDSTCSILDTWSKKMDLSWYTGTNLKPAKSFLDLLQHAGDSPYYAFSDQDDYWMPDKLITAIEALSEYEKVPALYFSQTQLADKDLVKIDSVIINPYLTLGEALVYQFIGGCTMVMNAKLRDIIIRHKPSYVPMHDVWIYNVALAIGAKVVFDPQPHMLYRQHGGNVIGQKKNDPKEWKERITSFVKGNHNSRSDFAREVYNAYQKLMPDNNLALLSFFLAGKNNIRKRLKLLFDKRFKCSNKKTYFLFKIAVLLNTY